MARLLIITGLVLLLVGIAIAVGGRFFGTAGRLPGDIVVKRGNFTFYFPIITSILLSILLTLVMWLFNRR